MHKIKFPEGVATTSNIDKPDERAIVFKNYIPMNKELRELTEEIDHFKRVTQVENLYKKKVQKVSTEIFPLVH